jgi:hypothetical protein
MFYNRDMPELKRATVYLEPSLHRALRVKAAHTDQSLSDLVNLAVRHALEEDANDLAVFEKRASERSHSFEDLLKDMKKRGEL